MLCILEETAFRRGQLFFRSLKLHPVDGQSLLGKRKHRGSKGSNGVSYGGDLVRDSAGVLRYLQKHVRGSVYGRAYVSGSSRNLHNLTADIRKAFPCMLQFRGEIGKTSGQLIVLIFGRRSTGDRRDGIINFRNFVYGFPQFRSRLRICAQRTGQTDSVRSLFKIKIQIFPRNRLQIVRLEGIGIRETNILCFRIGNTAVDGNRPDACPR